MTETRSGILAAVSNWMRLLALVVLVAEAAILAAMKLTPATSPIHQWYVVFMLAFLFVVVVGVFADRFLQHRAGKDDLTLDVGEKEWVAPSNLKEPPTHTAPDRLFVDSERGFQFETPISPDWSKPERLDLGQYLQRTGLIEDETDFPRVQEAMAVLPMGNMIAQSSVLCLWHGNPIEASVTDETTTSALETIISRLAALAKAEGEEISDEDKALIRRQQIKSEIPTEIFRVQNGIGIVTMDKKLAYKSPIKPTLPNLFRQLIQKYGPIDQLVATNETIIWGSTLTLLNVEINGARRELTAHTMFQLAETDRFFYQIGIYYTPQSQDSLAVWDDLQSMANSFRLPC